MITEETTAPPRVRPARDWELACWIGLVLLIVAVPTLAAWWQAPSGTLFTGFLSDRDQDAWSYIAKMRVGYDGGWRYVNLYTETPHTGVWGVFGYYLLLGHIARWTHLSLIATYHLARGACIIGFLVSLDRFLALLWPERRQRRWAFLLVTFAGGLGWLNEANAYWGDARLWPGWIFPADLVWAGVTTIGSIMLYSHYPLALWLILECYRQAYLAETQRRMPWEAALSAALLATHHAYDIVPVACTLTVWFAWRAWQYGLAPLFRLALIGLAAAVPVGYYYWVFTFHPMFSRWAKQNVCISPHPVVYLVAYGGVLLYALWGLQQKGRPAWLWRLLGVWVGVNALLLYAPFSWQRLMMLGLSLVLGMWGVRGLLALADRFPVQRRAVLILGVALVIPSTWHLYLVGWTSRSYVGPDEAAADRWLEARPHDGAVLASVVTGNRLAGLSGHPVYLGHWSETPNYHRALTETERWYKGELGRDWLVAHRIRYVVWGPREQVWRLEPPFATPPAYRGGGYAIWALQANGEP